MVSPAKYKELGFFIAVIFSFCPAHAADTAVAKPSPTPKDSINRLGISANPGAINQRTGTGELGDFITDRLGIKDKGIFIGGVWVGDANYLISGGVNPGSWSFNSLFIASLGIDAEKLVGWKGGSFGIEFLQFDGQNTNAKAGSVQGYNSLPGPAPLQRSELYQLWWRQELFDGKLIFRIGKLVPTNDFGNVLRPVSLDDKAEFIPAISGLLFTPIFVNPAMLGVMPGYYNSACGITTTFVPTKNFYLSYGVYDGNMANGTQTGMTGPQFNGYYFNIWQAGATWLLGENKLPGSFGVGIWNQTGELKGRSVSEWGATGVYLFGSQRLWFRHPGKDNSGITSYFQFGANNSETLPVNQYFGAGLTAFGLVPNRPLDSVGTGMAWSWLNKNDFNRSSELMFQTYYQAHLIKSTYFQPAMSYIPTPGANASLGGAWALTMRVIVLF
ncbi:MAG: carbohydrate porin [Chthoniobacterales bacterium]